MQVVDDNGELVLVDGQGNVTRGETRDLLSLLKVKIVEEELRIEAEERQRQLEEGIIRLSSVCLAGCLSVCLYVCLFVYLSVCLTVCMSVYFICLFVYVFVRIFVCVSVFVIFIPVSFFFHLFD